MKKIPFILGTILLIGYSILQTVPFVRYFDSFPWVWVLLVVLALLTVTAWLARSRVGLWCFAASTTVVALAALYLPALSDVVQRRVFEGFGGLGFMVHAIILPIVYAVWLRSVHRHASLLKVVQSPVTAEPAGTPTAPVQPATPYLPGPIFLLGILLTLVGLTYLILLFRAISFEGIQQRPIVSAALLAIGGIGLLRRWQPAFFLLLVAIILLAFMYPVPVPYLAIHLVAVVGLYYLFFRTRWFKLGR